MTNKVTVVVIGLAALTLAGFILVSRLVNPPSSGPNFSQPSNSQPVVASKAVTVAVPASFPNKPIQTDSQWRAELGQAQTLLEQIQADVVSGEWANAQIRLDEFVRKTEQLPAAQLNHPDISPVMQDFFVFHRMQLARSLSEQSRKEARITINQLFAIVGEQRARFGTRGVPLEFQRLRFLVREIEVWNEAGDEEMLGIRKKALREAWKDVRPVIIARRNGNEQAGNFDKLIERLSTQGHADTLPALVSELGKELERMNALFQRPPRPNGSPTGSTKPAEEDE